MNSERQNNIMLLMKTVGLAILISIALLVHSLITKQYLLFFIASLVSASLIMVIVRAASIQRENQEDINIEKSAMDEHRVSV